MNKIFIIKIIKIYKYINKNNKNKNNKNNKNLLKKRKSLKKGETECWVRRIFMAEDTARTQGLGQEFASL